MSLQTLSTPSTRIAPGGRFYLLFSAFTVLLFPLHESAHYLTYRALGVHLRMTLNTASPADQSQRVAIAELAGPLLNLIVATVATSAYLRSRQRRNWLAALALAAALMRIVIYVLVLGAAVATGSALSMGNDEPIAAQLAGVPNLTFVGVLAIPFVAIVAAIVRTFHGIPIRKAAHIFALGFTMMCLGIFIGNILDPWLFPRR